MTTPDETPTLQDLRRRRGQLKHAMADLEGAVAAPAPGRVEEWLENVRTQLAELTADFTQHCDLTERPGGFHDQMLASAPHLEGRVHRLARDHVALQHDLEEARAAVAAMGEGDGAVGEVRYRIGALLSNLSRHRQRGSDLVWEAFNYDLGGEN